MDAGLDENQAELAVLVLAVALEVLADGDGLAGVVSKECGPCECLQDQVGRRWMRTFLISM